jgi:hypothetical protein
MGGNGVAGLSVLDKGDNDVSHIFASFSTASNRGLDIDQSNSQWDNYLGDISKS